MSIFKRLFGTKKSIISEEELIEVGACPNCWGKQAYDDQFVDFVKDQTKSNINHDHSNQKAFIQQFVETNISGIRLKKDGDKLTCPACEKGYKQVSSKAN